MTMGCPFDTLTTRTGSSTGPTLTAQAAFDPKASALATVTGNVSVVQNGAGNTFTPAMLDRTTAATVIQNSLNNQDIKSLTTINASVNNLGQFSSSRLAESLQSALIGSLGH